MVVNDNVNHPAHYTRGKIEVIDFIEDQGLEFHLANAVKYICRAGYKNKAKTVEDLEKADWYLRRYIEKIAKPEAERAEEAAKQKVIDVLTAITAKTNKP
jgi:hypothetical protein